MKRLLALVLISSMAFARGSSALCLPGSYWTESGHFVPSTPLPDSDRLWLDLLPQAKGPTTLVGGTVRNLDYVRDQVTVRVFGGRDLVVLFDDRTHFYRDGLEGSIRDLQTGVRVYSTPPWPDQTYSPAHVRVV